MTDVGALGEGKYISVTTFRKDGSAVATPVWLVRRRNELLVLTQESSGKVKRIRSNPQVLVAPCDARGHVKGEPVAAVARLQDEIETHLTANLIQHRYGLMGRMFGWLNEVRDGGRGDGHIGITITLP
jgi:PPOX class probable F420-dependent enzyme